MKKIDNSARYVFENNKANIELIQHFFSWWSVDKEITQCFNGIVTEEQIQDLWIRLKEEFIDLKNNSNWTNYPVNYTVALVDGRFEISRG